MIQYNVISHTHWDREWYFSFDKFRVRLVDMVDHLLDILEKDSNYIFHMDAQTIVLEDYLEIRPYKKPILMKYIQEGRLIVGPWYVQNDFYLSSGEATIRNLIIGTAIAEEYGACAKVGYAPDQFGNISQLPQILQGFGIDNFIFGRGYQKMEWDGHEWHLKSYNSEFLWKGPDESYLIAIYLRHWYNNAQRFSANISDSIDLLEEIRKSFKGNVGSNQLLLMNGVDHLEAQENLLPILYEINKRLSENESISQTTMEAYVRKVQEYYRNNQEVQLDTWVGELRTGQIYNILQNTLSSRIYLKKSNERLQRMLEHKIERLYSFIEMMGGVGTYPKDYLRWLWKELIKNHAHDSICGCSTDLVHENMEDRFKRIEETGNVLIERGMEFLVGHIDRSGLSEDDDLILIFNPHQMRVSDVIDIEVEFLRDEKVEGFIIEDNLGNEIEYRIKGKKMRNKNIYSPINLPGVKVVDVFQLQMMAKDAPSLGYLSYRIKKSADIASLYTDERKLVSHGKLINDYLTVNISSEGKISIEDHETGRIFNHVLKLIDEGDVGDNYRQRHPNNDKIFDFSAMQPKIHQLQDDSFKKIYTLSYEPSLPVSYDFDKDRRHEIECICPVRMRLTLANNQRWVEVEVVIDNHVIDHRFRAYIDTRIQSNLSYGSTPFDLIAHERCSTVDKINNDDQANNGFIAIEEEDLGLAIFNKGLYEYEHLDVEKKGILALTLLRSTGYISRNYDKLQEISPHMVAQGGNCIREMRANFALCPFGGKFSMQDALQLAQSYQTPLMTYAQPVDLTKFNGGRPAVQGSVVSEIFYREDTHPKMRLPRTVTGIVIEGEGIILSALKLAEDNYGYILRVYNTTTKSQQFSIRFPYELNFLAEINLAEKNLRELDYSGNSTKDLTLRAKGIMTLRYCFGVSELIRKEDLGC